MKIKNRLYVSAGISIILVATLLFVILVTSRRVSEVSGRHDLIDNVRVSISELDLITYDYLLHREKRMEHQWNLKYKSLGEVLDGLAEEEGLKSIHAAYSALGNLFSQITANYKERQKYIQEGASQERIDIASRQEERFVAQLLITSHSVITDASRFAEKTRAEVMEVQRLAANLTLILMIILAIIVTSTSLLVARSIAKPLDKLTKGAEVIGKGNLEHRVEIKSKDEIGELAAAFNQMTEDLEKATALHERLNMELAQKNKELEQLLFVTTHDLRSPLVNIQGFSKELGHSITDLVEGIPLDAVSPDVIKKVKPILNEDIPESLQYIQTSIAKMDSLLSGLLRLSRLGRAAITITKLDMNKLVADSVAALEFNIKESNTQLNVSKLPACKGDASQISQVFSNLLDNALKYLYTSRQGVIKISGKKKEKMSIYCIEDNGIGIASDHQEKIFEIFHRLEPKGSEGEGLGLTIAKRALDRQGGEIWIESEEGKGSKFFVQLPC